MSEKDIEKQHNEFKGALSGSMEGLHSGTMITQELEAKDLSKKQRRENTQEIQDLLIELCEQMHKDLMFQIDLELEAVRLKMLKNRTEWDVRANRLEEIDELFEAIKDGKALDKIKAKHLIEGTGKSISEHSSNADYYTVLVAIKTEDLQHIEVLDTDFQNLEEQEKYYKTVQQKANNIANDDSLDNHQKLEAYESLNKEMSAADFTQNAYHVENYKQKSDAEVVSKNNYHQQVSDNSSYQITGMKLQ